jgi:glutathione S-transferase
MNYVSPAEGRKLPGLRLVLSVGVPNPWGEAAKAILKIKGIGFIPVAHHAMAPNDELREWTGVRDAPVAILDDEAPLSIWIQILLMAERIGSGPSLLPEDALERALVIGISHEICGQDGFGWNRRLLMIEANSQQPGTSQTTALHVQLLKSWKASPETLARAHPRVIGILTMLADMLKRQQAAGSAYLVGKTLTACDVYWAAFSQFIAPLPQKYSPLQDWNRANFAAVPDDVKAALDPILMKHRDMVFQRHVGLPLDF